FNSLVLLNISAVLLATIGGFGSIFALLISPQIRAYNRISVYIAFISLFALAVLIDLLIKKYNKSKLHYTAMVGVICILIIIGILDQTDRSLIPNYQLLKEEYLNDREFVGNIESSVPESSIIYQLPYVPFPENPPVYK